MLGHAGYSLHFSLQGEWQVAIHGTTCCQKRSMPYLLSLEVYFRGLSLHWLFVLYKHSPLLESVSFPIIICLANWFLTLPSSSYLTMDLHSVPLYFTSKFIRAMCNLQSPLLLDRKLKPKNRFIHSVHNLLDRPTTITTSLPSTHPSTHTPLNSSESGIFFSPPH